MFGFLYPRLIYFKDVKIKPNNPPIKETTTMKFTTLKNLAAAVIVVASTSAFAKGANGEMLAKKGGAPALGQLNISLTFPQVGEQTILPQGVSPGYLSPSGYTDLQALCVNALGIIKQARIKAEMAIDFGNYEGAVAALVAGLQSASNEFSYGSYGRRANPATVMAIRHGAMLAAHTARDTEKFRPLLKENTSALKLNLVNKVVELVEETFEELDKPFFFSSVGSGHCMGHGCYKGPSRHLGIFRDGYFSKTADVAAKFISIYTGNSGMMAANLLKLSIASQASWSAAEILNTSPFRFDYACAVSRLDYINTGISDSVKEYITMPEGNDVQRRAKERFLFIVANWATREMVWALNQVNLQSCELKKSLKTSGPKHGHGNNDDDDITVKSKSTTTTVIDSDGDGDVDYVSKTKTKSKTEVEID